MKRAFCRVSSMNAQRSSLFFFWVEIYSGFLLFGTLAGTFFRSALAHGFSFYTDFAYFTSIFSLFLLTSQILVLHRFSILLHFFLLPSILLSILCFHKDILIILIFSYLTLPNKHPNTIF
ncbi:hypothetical protein DM860_007597 [Cuscuta australis]|uniref:Uncharacterized protein n=1 Tax=Cuscuta australis TaxID=267555 RepID=A0A328E8A0_9ASTE|nr:hypothetical protein DM860_007597 [Cuscuta australis]